MADAAAPSAAAAPDPALFFEPVAIRDALVILTLPPDPIQTEQGSRTRGAKRRRSQQAAAARTVEHEVSAYQLQSASPKFRAALERWSEGGKRELRFECADEQEAESWGHLLDCIHSMGRTLPADLDAIMRLLLLAREQAAEPAVAACLRALHGQVDQMPPTMCLELLSQLETGVSEHQQLQTLGDRLLAAACERLAGLLGSDDALRADVAVQAQLLAFLGPLQHMLNDTRRRDLFAKLPYELLQDCIFEDRNVNADAEATVLAAFAFWAQENLQQLDAEAVERATAICSRIRFPNIPSSVLQNYWGCWEFLRRFDPTGDILMRAVVAANEPQQQQMWGAELQAAANDGQGRAGRQFTGAQFAAKCSSWWQPRQPPLTAEDGAAEFAVEVARGQSSSDVVFPERQYWNGYWWRLKISKKVEDRVGIHVIPSMSLGGGTFSTGKPKALAYGIKADHTIRVDGSGVNITRRSTHSWFLPSKGSGWGWDQIRHQGQPVAWDAFWAADSPWLVNGTARMRFTLKVST